MIASLLVASLVHSNLVIFLALSLVVVGAMALQGPFWALPPTFLGGAAAAGGIALINSIGTGGGGFAGPYVLGLMRQATGSFAAGIATLAIGPLLTTVIVLYLGRAKASRPLAVKPVA
jgi:ACS family tartrate transporter-like MFS transporter